MIDDELWAAFRAPSLPAADWTHRAHLRVAWLHLARYRLDEAHVRMRAGILKLNATHGIDEGPERGYHETMTRAWLSAVAGAREGGAREGRAAHDSLAFCEAHPELLGREYLLRFYSRERLFSLQARAVFLAPDLAPLQGLP